MQCLAREVEKEGRPSKGTSAAYRLAANKPKPTMKPNPSPKKGGKSIA